MGASRKLQGEIDRVLKKVQEGVDIFDSIWNKVYDTENANQKEKFEADLKKEIKKLQRYRDQIKSWIQSSEIKDKKVSASYEQALMDARKQIEREMERFKVCEKETKTKAFSKEGLGQQPKTDPKEKAKSETRDWLNNIVGDLESQIDNFEAEIEGLSVKKGKSKPNRLTHLETSITRHKTHIMKLEWILRLLDNDELSPEQVNDVKEFLEDYVERNQEDFEEFSNPDELYSALQLEKVESLDDFAIASTTLVKLSPLTSSLPSQVGGLGIQGPGLSVISSAPQQQNSVQQSSQHALLSVGSKDSDPDRMKVEEQQQQQQQQQQQSLSDDSNAESALNSGLKQNLTNEDDLESTYMPPGSTSTADGNQGVRDIDLSPGQPLQPSQSSASLGVIGRRSVPDLGAIVDNITVANPGVLHDHAYNLQMLEASYFKLPQTKDSERVKNYIPRKPAVTPSSYPQTQHQIVDNPAFWDRLGSEKITDILFYAFYYQQNTYQQYLAAKELKRQSWRYHRKYNTWFQRHEEPTVTNDDFEQGTYVYFDFHITDDLQNGWCQRIKTEFTFEYSYLEDELV
ncbi:unnamed protein product [Spirodela intermedia]|uniref:Uncharacterized protein n=1 Tax=Spirodela intermedia TaxID=51605 RepID=A0A7I8JWU0_SPIIN|nr:unnamed protein product [Spirodela intermedia]